MVGQVAFFAPYTEHVGTEGAMLKIADHFESEGIDVDLLRVYEEWPDERNPPGRIVELDATWSSTGIKRLPFPWKKFFLAGISLSKLVAYLRKEEPDVLVAGLLSAIAVGARDLAGVDTRVVVTVQGLPQPDRIRRLLWPHAYARADAIVAPAVAVGNRTAEIVGLPPEEIRTIPNPVVTDELVACSRETPDHPWFDGDTETVVALGRQTRQKDFSTLLRAFARLRESRDARLVVPGKTDEMTPHLRELRDELGLTDIVDFPGFVDNPYAYINAADVFVLSSKWEGPGHVLIEALAIGTPVVATDCPAGPREILRDGDAGALVPVGDSNAMADAISDLLDDPERQERYVQEGRKSAEKFRAERAAAEYLEVCRGLTDERS